jgi:protein-disulfide isomerase
VADVIEADAPARANGLRRLTIGGVALVVVLIAIAGIARASSNGRSRPGTPAATGDPLSEKGPKTSGVNVAGQPSLGPKDAPIIIIEFTDYGCSFCAKYHRESFAAVMALEPGRIRYVVRNDPNEEAHPGATKAAEAAECAHEQGKFWAYHDGLFATQKLAVPDLKTAASAVGLDRKRFDSCLDSGRMAGEVTTDSTAASIVGNSGTPTFFINGRRIDGNKPADAFRHEIDEALAGHVPASSLLPQRQ